MMHEGVDEATKCRRTGLRGSRQGLMPTSCRGGFLAAFHQGLLNPWKVSQMLDLTSHADPPDERAA